MGLTFEYMAGQTPLDEEEMEGILIPSISSRSNLDEFEQQNSELKYLLDNATYWHNTYPSDEIAIRFKHQIVSIHCFSNGNGRHSRLIADIIIDKLFNKPVFTWGVNLQLTSKEIRAAYLASLKEADLGDYKSLLEFARS